MCKVISFRLDQNNPREAEALSILDDRLSQGFSTRHTLTEALLLLDSSKFRSLDNGALNDLTNQIIELLASVDSNSTHKEKSYDISAKQEKCYY